VNYDAWLTQRVDEWIGEVRPLTPEEKAERDRDEQDRRHLDD
jgi:hypothetical protein